MDFVKAKAFIYAYARPLDLARYKFHFENGSRDDVLRCLGAYQNSDGGFGHALEPDYFNPHSSPIQTWRALDILEEIGFPDKDHPIMQSILAYLASGDGFNSEENQWAFQVPSNNDYPHAIWWKYHPQNLSFSYNPSAYLAGFIIRYGNKHTKLYKNACLIAQQAYDFITQEDTLSGDTLRCFISLYRFLLEAEVNDLIPLEGLKAQLIEKIDKEVCSDTSKYGVEYVTLPSKFFPDQDAFFIEGHEGLIQKEIELLPKMQKSDGAMDIYWNWYTPYKEFETARLWWRSDLTIRALLFEKAFKR